MVISFFSLFLKAQLKNVAMCISFHLFCFVDIMSGSTDTISGNLAPNSILVEPIPGVMVNDTNTTFCYSGK